MDPIDSNFLAVMGESPPAAPTYLEGFGQASSRATNYTFTLTSPKSAYRWALVTMTNAQSATGTQHPITFTINGSTTFLGNVGSVTVGNGVSNDGNASASAYVSQTLVRIPYDDTITVRGDWAYPSGGLLGVAILSMPALNVTSSTSVSADAAATRTAQNLSEVANGFTIAGFTGTYGSWSAISWTGGLDKFPVNTTSGLVVASLAWRGMTASGTTSYNMSHTSTDNRARIISNWATSF